MISRGMDGLEKVGNESRRQRRVGKKQLQGLKPTEDERKLQTKLFVKLCVEAEKLKPPLNDCGYKNTKTSRLKSRGFFCFMHEISFVREYN